VAVVGSISRQRGQDVLVEALPSLRERVPDVRVLMVGDPHPRPADRAYRGELAERAGRLGVAEQVVWTGAVERIADVYAAADAVVNPTRRESFGRVAAEALLAGRPVVSTRVGGVPEVLRDGVDGLLVEPDSPDALAAAVVRVLTDPDLAARLVDAGAERVRREFSRERSLAGFAEAVWALESGAPAARAADRDRTQREGH
jgi:glycosyltransferase involved in cell wall biosynthesis